MSIQVTVRGLTKAVLTFGELDEGEFFTTLNEPGIWCIKAGLPSMNEPIAVRLNDGYGNIIDGGVRVILLSTNEIIEITNKKE